MRIHWRLALMLAIPLAAGGCASTPDPLRGEFEPLAAADAGEDDIGTEVRWGGRLLGVTPERERTCFEILAKPLNRIARPHGDDPSSRRFLACRDGFVEPAGFPEDRLITVVGELSGFETRPVGDYDYRYPVVAVRGIYLWSEPVEPAYYDPYPYPYYHPFGYHDPFFRPPRTRFPEHQ